MIFKRLQLPPALRKEDMTTFEQMVAQAGEKWIAEHGEDFVQRTELEKAVQEKQEKEKQMQEKDRLIEAEKQEKARLRKATIKAGLQANFSMKTLMQMTALSKKEVQKIIAQIGEEEKGKPGQK